MWVGVACRLTLHGVADERGEIIAQNNIQHTSKAGLCFEILNECEEILKHDVRKCSLHFRIWKEVRERQELALSKHSIPRKGCLAASEHQKWT